MHLVRRKNASVVRKSRYFGHGVLAETNLSANQIRDNIKRALSAFGLPERAFSVYLREDRNAGNAGGTG